MSIADVYQRLGSVIDEMAGDYEIESAAVLAVFKVESGGKKHVPGQAIIRFENHVLRKQWDDHETYAQYFQHDAHKAWQGHRWRANPDDEWQACHTDQEQEYAVLELARSLAGDEAAYASMSIGGCQIMGFNYEAVGYASACEMYDAFQESEENHVRGFFAFCDSKSLIDALRDRDWVTFAKGYNGPGQAEDYARLIDKAYQEALLVVPPPLSLADSPAAQQGESEESENQEYSEGAEESEENSEGE